MKKSSLPEQVTLIVSTALVLGTAGFIAWHGLATSHGPPSAEARVQIDRVRRAGNSWTLPVEVKSTCDVPLEDINAVVSLTGKDGARDEIDIAIPYLPERGTETIYVISETPPETARPEANVTHFKASANGKGY